MQLIALIMYRGYEREKSPALTAYVLTDIDGERFYAVTLTIYQKVTVSAITDDSTTNTDDANAAKTRRYLCSHLCSMIVIVIVIV